MFQKRTARSDRRGATTVELAFVLLPFLLFVWAVFDYGRFVMVRHLLANAAREGARMAVVNTDVSDNANNRQTEEIEAAVRKALAGQQLSNLRIQVYRADADGNYLEAQWAAKATYQDNVAVEIDADFSPLFPSMRFLSGNASRTVPVKAKSVMISEGL